jgi:hypothetical protein
MFEFNDTSTVSSGEDTGGKTIMTPMAARITQKNHEPESRPLDTLLRSVGRLVFAWGTLEAQLEQKIADLRSASGDIRSAMTRTKPTIARMLSELRAIVSMRCRRDNVQLDEIAEIERAIQQIDKFRMLVIQGFQVADEASGTDKRLFLCRDAKNNVIGISLGELESEISRLDACRERLLAL